MIGRAVYGTVQYHSSPYPGLPDCTSYASPLSPIPAIHHYYFNIFTQALPDIWDVHNLPISLFIYSSTPFFPGKPL